MEQNIRRYKTKQDDKYRTQAGQAFYTLIHRLAQDSETIFVSFDVDSINSKWMPGVSAPSVIGGFTS
jgi:arginase family enzyme